jgi:Bacterial regulatory proteins, luxR family
VFVSNTRELVAELLASGLSSVQVARVLGVSKSTVCYHKRRLGLEIDAKFNRRYDWAEVQRFYDEGHTISECQVRFGFARATFVDAAKRGDLRTRPQGAPIEVYLVAGLRTNRTHLKQRLLAEGLKQNRCERCGSSPGSASRCRWRRITSVSTPRSTARCGTRTSGWRGCAPPG